MHIYDALNSLENLCLKGAPIASNVLNSAIRNAVSKGLEKRRLFVCINN